MTDMIENCISNCWFSVLFNGKTIGYFHGSRGLRQGDPISPTLFIIAVEYLSRGLYNMFQRYPSLYYLVRCPVLVPHLAFADDIIFFFNGTKSSIKRITNFLVEYEQCSCQKVNSSKSGFILSARASLSRASVVGGALGFHRIRLPTKYLGMPLYRGPKKSFLWDDLISRIAARMEGWEAKVLLPGGCITILNSIFTSMPLYLLHVIVPPKSVMCRIERLFNKFLWSSKGQKRIHWECWEDLCYPVEEGGLGMRRLQDLVNAMSLKLWWRFRTVNNLWSNFMNCKYGYNSASFSGGASVHDSLIWKRLSKASHACEYLIRWKVGCGKINFWHDIWIDNSALYRYNPPIGESHLPVSFYWRSNAWYLDQVRSKIPNDIIDSLYLIDVCSTRVDHPLWSLTAHGGFTMYSAWNRMRQVSVRQLIFSKIWHASILLKMSFFIWRLINDFVPVDTRIQRKGICMVSKCYGSNDIESLEHLFLFCPTVSPVWNFFAAMFFISLLVDGSIKHWLSTWFFLGDYVFAGEDFPTFQAGLLKRRNWKGDMKMASFFGFQGNSVVAGGGGILRDWHGNVSFFFFLSLKAKSALHAQILTLYHGLNICKDRVIHRVWIEMDALSVINLVQNRCIGSWEVCYNLQGIYDCLYFFQFHLTHIYREGNQVADHLATLGSKAANLHIGSSLDDFSSLRGLIRTDKLNLPYFRHAFIYCGGLRSIEAIVFLFSLEVWFGSPPNCRRIEDNILLAQELVQLIDEKTRGSNVILKLDMMKAYDTIDWAFIIKIMRKFGFCSKMTDMIENCISNCWFSVLFNGETTGYFHGSRGLRQGDPISPTLFIIVAEYLSRGLYNMFQRYPSLHYLARCPVLVPHLAFADDIIIFSNASLSRASVVGGALGFHRIRLPTKYLGMPLYRGPKKSFLWDDLISRITARMEGWEVKVLSPGGRITILKSILTSMPLYLLHVIVPPKSECWEDLCYPVEEGGLGMRRLQDLVNAMSGASVHASPIWKRLSKAGRACENLIRWKVGCGKINFWHDIWVDDSALSSNRVDHPLWSLTAHGGFTMYSAWNRMRQVSGKIFQLFQARLVKRRNWKGDMKLASFFGCHYVLDQVYSPKMVRWIKPKEHCFKLNVDGSFQGNSAVAGGGGILRDWHGNVSFFFFLSLKAKSALHAQILTLYHGLNICKDRAIHRVWIEMDALSVINLVQNRCIGSWEVCYSLQGIYDCLNFFQFHLTHIYREGNQVADHLAALRSKAANLHIGSSLDDFPSLRGLIRTDKLNLPYFCHAFI
ncbi:hypothetical protein SADUNF_Sadunf09G0000200 [Salix dunnii]|uniref:Reverse transcriptase domain-containing protein n=1 Tax=Salix dunnii TaxID=1413687 RepID=A0A835JTA0_9ROSI|nr:hypothetical protein SADUNF_Sadunf09G0000200 [Salix dunnii]